MGSITKKVGRFFKEHRSAAGVSSEQVADYLGLGSVGELNDMEAGLVPIPLKHIFSLANIYGIDPDEIVVFFYDLTCEADADSVAKAGSDD